jgi:TonB-linked SusC/RagA family outer membrane protein
VAEETAAVKLPFTVEQVGAEELPVPPQSAEAAIRGKVSGVKMLRDNGTPGGGVTVMLRGATSISTSGRTNEPLYVVDGVILGASMVDVDALDIENIEVVKGAAAAALYGARAANGVISIQTRRGSEIPDGETSIIFRSEFGKNNIENLIPQAQAHWYVIQDGQWLGEVTDAAGTRDSLVGADDRAKAIREEGWGPNTDWVDDSTDWDGDGTFSDHSYYVSDNAFPGATYDNLKRFFNPGTFYTNSLSVSHRTGSTNFRASAHETSEQGVVDGMDGYTRRGVRLNVDHRIGRAFDFNASAYYSQSIADDPQGGENAFYSLNFYPIDVDLKELNDPARDSIDYLINPDPSVVEANPLYSAQNRDEEHVRGRVLGSLGVRWRPTDVFDLRADFSYDRSDRNDQFYYFKGFRTLDPSSTNNGQLQKNNNTTQALNGSLDLTYTNRFGDLATNFKLRGLVERQERAGFFALISDFAVSDVRDMDVGNNDNADVGSSSSAINSLGFFLSTQFDYKDRYILDALVRRDGSSLFGEDQRWHWYYRLGFAYRLSQESFWNIGWMPEFKLRASLGTAGGRPSFSAQYETYNVSSGQVTKGNLGNTELKPEKATELELGADMIFGGSVSLSLTYADSKVEDQILLVPLAGYYGFSNQWRNAGTLESTTYEASLQWAIIQQANVGWSVNFVTDRTRQEITEFDLPAYRTQTYFYVRDGEVLGTMYGTRWASSCDEILTDGGFNAAGVCENFQLNDDGYMVPVGAGNSYQDGITENYFGSKITIDGKEYDWGLPFGAEAIQVDTLPDGAVFTDTTDFLPIGGTQSDFNFGVGQTLRYKGFSLYALFDAQIGGDIFNNTRQWAARDGNAWEVDQSGKAEGNKKSYDYYQRLYWVNASNSHYVEDATNMKFRELSLRYSFNRGQLEGVLGGFFKRVTLAAIGRNLITWTGYSGYDPEVSNSNDGAVYRIDAFDYPNYRTFTGSVEIEF